MTSLDLQLGAHKSKMHNSEDFLEMVFAYLPLACAIWI